MSRASGHTSGLIGVLTYFVKSAIVFVEKSSAIVEFLKNGSPKTNPASESVFSVIIVEH